jgi:eukaryotic-like serine/threonine-protein kinase
MPEAAEEFLKSVLRSGLLDRNELTAALRSLPRDRLDKPRELANHLIQQGKLSRFQAHKLLAGATLGLRLGNYLIQTPIGRGGMGTVFLATDRRTGAHLAIKALPPKRARAEERYLARFQREMELSQKVSHPHIAQTHEAGVSQGVYFIAMEYIPGQSLYRLVTSQGPLTVPRAAGLFAEVASALQHAHHLGMIHRDLKPSNIMVTPNDHAKILDLGLAMMEGEVGEDIEIIGGRGYVVGSVDYMAPEQTLDATNVDSRSDLYALGCVLYFALTGKPPFPAGKTKDKINAHRRQEPDPIQWRNQEIPDSFAAIVHKLMAKNPAERYASAAAVRAEFLAYCPTQSIRPVEKEGDQSQQAAARALEAAPLSPEILKAEPLPVAEPLPFVEGIPVAEPILPPEFYEQRSKNEVWANALGVGGFWLAVAVVLLLIWLLK